MGRLTFYSYDDRGQLRTLTLPDPDGAGPLTAPVYAYSYDAAHRLWTQTDPLGNVTTYEHDKLGRLTKVTRADPDAPARRPPR